MSVLKILYIEDSRADVDMVVRMLNKSDLIFELKQAENRHDFEDLLESFIPDIILSDHSLYQFDSLEAFKIVKQKNLNIPFILVTGTISEDFAMKILKTGASDYILKNNLSRLPIAITNAIKEREIERDKINYQKQLEEKNKDLNTLIYKITHDLRGPVCSILGLIEIAQKDIGDNEYISKISESALKLDSILLSLIDTMYTRDANIKGEMIDFKEIINEIKQKFEYLNQFREVEINYLCSSESFFFSDRKIIMSIFQNIIENSYKYKNHATSKSVIDITITHKNNFVTIEISDNGIGISEEIHHKVFDMFFRGNSDSKGSGLGLYLVKTGVEKLKGNIRMESKLKKGTKFIISLPNVLPEIDI